jgi:hypothetical protein
MEIQIFPCPLVADTSFIQNYTKIHQVYGFRTGVEWVRWGHSGPLGRFCRCFCRDLSIWSQFSSQKSFGKWRRKQVSCRCPLWWIYQLSRTSMYLGARALGMTWGISGFLVSATIASLPNERDITIVLLHLLQILCLLWVNDVDIVCRWILWMNSDF